MTWVKFWTRDYTYHYIENCLASFTILLSRLKITPFRHMLFIRKDGLFSIHSYASERQRFDEEITKRFASSSNALNRFKAIFMNRARNYYNAAAKGCRNPKLSAGLAGYYKAWLDYTTMVWIIWNLNDSYSTQLCQKISEKAARLGKAERIPEYLACAAGPAKKSSILQLNEMIATSKAQHKQINAAALLRKYIWMPHGDLHAAAWTEKHVKKYVEEHTALVKKPMSISQLAKELKLTAKEREEIIIGKNLAYLSDYRDEVRRKTVYIARKMYEAAAKRFHVPYSDLMFYSTPETLALFKARRLPAQEIERRKGDAVCMLKKGRLVVLTGSKASAVMKELLLEEELQTEVKGLTASAGKATGIAKIVRLDSEISKIKRGDVMVAVTTHPEYVPKMAIAAAIVTDEGGLTCHAAVISREMKKPCIVGAKNATKLIRDGDLVEVDADSGVVRKVT